MAAKTPVQLRDVDNALELVGGSFVELPKIDVPYTTIVGRAQCTDFSKDLCPRVGIERVVVQFIEEVQGEFGPNGERIFKPKNDFHDQIRMGGVWNSTGSLDGREFQNGGDVAAFLEITFYGTGLNILGMADSDRNFDVYVDGVFSASRTTGGTSSVLRQRGYAQLQPFNAVSGLALGLHTVRLANLVNARWWGFEILNEATTLKTATGSSFRGGKKLTLAALDSQAYNSGFEATYGTPGTKGGHVVVYQKADGSIGKAIRYTEASTLTNTSANHTNEELIRRYKYREFGANRADDFSTLAPGLGSTRAFTLDDGTTNLSSVGVVADLATLDNLDHGTSSIFTFVGTGLDFIGSTGTDTRFSIDGGAEVVLPSGVTLKNLKIVSGLPYGTHTVKLTRPGSGLRISSFDVYGPKKPAIPDGATELADYYLMADYVANTTSGLNTIATGVLRKHCTSELIYTGTWGLGSVSTNSIGGWGAIANPGPGQTVRYTFFGTGFEYRFQTTSGTYSNTISVDGSTNLSGFTTSIYQPAGHTLTFTAATGVIGGTGGTASPGAGVRVSGLTLGLHTVVITINNANALIVDTLDIITPIHSPKSNLPGVLQNTLPVGSCSIGDGRVFAESQDLDIPNWAQAVGVTSNPTTTSTSFVPAADMLLTLKTNGNPIEVSYSVNIFHDTVGQSTRLVAYVDGIAAGNERITNCYTAGTNTFISDSFTVPVSAGIHTVQLMWVTSGGTAGLSTTRRNLVAKEL